MYNVDGFKSSWRFSAPGLPYLDYKCVIKVDTADITNWRDGMIKKTSGILFSFLPTQSINPE
jgi:hypothetical protein